MVRRDSHYHLVAINTIRYVVLLVEAMAVIVCSCLWRVLSFKHTHLVERNGLLTLIILGEGILGLTESVAKIVSKTGDLTNSDVGIIVSGVLLVVSTFDVR